MCWKIRQSSRSDTEAISLTCYGTDHRWSAECATFWNPTGCWVLYVGHFINTGHNPVFSVLLVLIGLWIPAAINLSGVKNMDPVVAGRRRPLGPL
jgi:hypothetical protein